MCTFAVPFDEGAIRSEGTTKFIDNTERDNEVKKLKKRLKSVRVNSSFFELRIGTAISRQTSKNLRDERSRVDSLKYEKENKSERWMPRLPEARKDVVSCDKLRGFANRN